ncbi:Envelope glycoprotein like [Actinidia chinensis var. chinensis]|uniref:Envelope glycoprotein like n=1 Tax=Actinidia chinensis var. chinensis TaxID=1590841 RepID=A0A2R6R189_ACTCC|nr:Envelope glycoprotein like [Actinidia chinensis var. chinensis]
MNQVGTGPIFRAENGYPYMEKRQLFLRSYQFSRKKKTVGERISGSFFRVKKVICVRLRSTRKVRKMVWSRVRNGLFFASRKRRFLRLHSQNNSNNSSSEMKSFLVLFF